MFVSGHRKLFSQAQCSLSTPLRMHSSENTFSRLSTKLIIVSSGLQLLLHVNGMSTIPAHKRARELLPASWVSKLGTSSPNCHLTPHPLANLRSPSPVDLVHLFYDKPVGYDGQGLTKVDSFSCRDLSNSTAPQLSGDCSVSSLMLALRDGNEARIWEITDLSRIMKSDPDSDLENYSDVESEWHRVHYTGRNVFWLRCSLRLKEFFTLKNVQTGKVHKLEFAQRLLAL